MAISTHPTCALDRSVLNSETVGQMDDLGLSVFANLCGWNRGAFVLTPPDGNTYGCTSFPEIFSINAGITDPNTAVPDSTSLTKYFSGGNITSSQTVEILDQYLSAVYATSGSGELNPYGCDVNGLAKLSCKSVQQSLLPSGEVVKAVTLAGAFVPAPWVTGGSKHTSPDYYTSKDFNEMAALGVNTVQIPVMLDALTEEGEVAKMLRKVEKAGLSAILVLVKPKDAEASEEAITSAAHFAKVSSAVIALQLPSPDLSLLAAVRVVSTKLPVLVPTNKDELKSLSFPPDKHLFAAIDMEAASSVADIASSDSKSDRMKMFYHESITCIDRTPIEWLNCYQDMPVYVSSGFDLAIDDCIYQDDEDFKDYGQCDRFKETLTSGWWEHHRRSLASRQLFAYSKGIGWSFSGWKLIGDKKGGKERGIKTPANLLCLRDVAAAGLMPPLDSTSEVELSCLNGPVADFMMGDETYAPTPMPIDCESLGGWWDESIGNCAYWIPPEPTMSPTDKPTMPCPSCDGLSTSTMIMVSAGGAVVALLLQWLYQKVIGGRNGGRYQSLP